ncbi:MAG: hypothetical protein RLZZ507_4149 [Cyanobacteriota bacterium]|jgi:hypothetical protein
MSNQNFALATAKIIRILYDISVFTAPGKFCHGWEYRCRNIFDELAYFTEIEGKNVCYLREARQFCKFSEAAWLIVEGKPDNLYLRDSKGSTHGEHIVPTSLVKSITFNMLNKGASNEQIASMLSHLVEIVFISKDEKNILDRSIAGGGFGLKTSMPNGWDLNVTEYDWSTANRYARLDFAGIQLAQQTINNSIRKY